MINKNGGVHLAARSYPNDVLGIDPLNNLGDFPFNTGPPFFRVLFQPACLCVPRGILLASTGNCYKIIIIQDGLCDGCTNVTGQEVFSTQFLHL